LRITPTKENIMKWLKAKMAWLWRFGVIRRTTAFRWEMDYALRG
jgi:hypothetical protein